MNLFKNKNIKEIFLCVKKYFLIKTYIIIHMYIPDKIIKISTGQEFIISQYF